MMKKQRIRIPSGVIWWGHLLFFCDKLVFILHFHVMISFNKSISNDKIWTFQTKMWTSKHIKLMKKKKKKVELLQLIPTKNSLIFHVVLYFKQHLPIHILQLYATLYDTRIKRFKVLNFNETCKWFLNNVYFAGDILLKKWNSKSKNINFESF
jgi:hypothetical protein